ncbi:MAG: 4-hydroxy-3-methylbut-2-enyl diphosphate reductase [Candidatus Aminicenantes bacterium]|nr:4-hydroxy-3-methylbut-2-enyl diphosphate reductase [Candidatus Aminicenantes bacterium]MBL7084005.1 4-hydroxy-3-methylbut-2-enyl diphosphate reductase [Candidatus Aminicenantes bacterium]
MQIIIAKNSGLCYGVKRALNIARETRQKKSGNVFTLGDLIHNPQVISDLKEQGILSINNLDRLNGATVIIRSHGISPDIYKLLAKKNIKIVDATCPIVKKIQRLVEVLSKEKEEIIIVGNKEHPEIKGLIGFSQKRGIIVENEAQVKPLPHKKKRAVLAQSTQDFYLFEKIVSALIEKTEELKVYNTICHSTKTRQKSTSELASCVDTLFIVGGKNSSNTNKLYQISKRILPNTHFIESANQITQEMLKTAKKIGLSGGASTPPEAIQEAVVRIKTSFKHQSQREKIVQCQR